MPQFQRVETSGTGQNCLLHAITIGMLAHQQASDVPGLEYERSFFRMRRGETAFVRLGLSEAAVADQSNFSPVVRRVGLELRRYGAELMRKDKGHAKKFEAELGLLYDGGLTQAPGDTFYEYRGDGSPHIMPFIATAKAKYKTKDEFLAWWYGSSSTEAPEKKSSGIIGWFKRSVKSSAVGSPKSGYDQYVEHIGTPGVTLSTSFGIIVAESLGFNLVYTARKKEGGYPPFTQAGDPIDGPSVYVAYKPGHWEACLPKPSVRALKLEAPEDYQENEQLNDGLVYLSFLSQEQRERFNAFKPVVAADELTKEGLAFAAAYQVPGRPTSRAHKNFAATYKTQIEQGQGRLHALGTALFDCLDKKPDGRTVEDFTAIFVYYALRGTQFASPEDISSLFTTPASPVPAPTTAPDSPQLSSGNSGSEDASSGSRSPGTPATVEDDSDDDSDTEAEVPFSPEPAASGSLPGGVSKGSASGTYQPVLDLPDVGVAPPLQEVDPEEVPRPPGSTSNESADTNDKASNSKKRSHR